MFVRFHNIPHALIKKKYNFHFIIEILKKCLHYNYGVDLKKHIRSNISDKDLNELINNNKIGKIKNAASIIQHKIITVLEIIFFLCITSPPP